MTGRPSSPCEMLGEGLEPPHGRDGIVGATGADPNGSPRRSPATGAPVARRRRPARSIARVSGRPRVPAVTGRDPPPDERSSLRARSSGPPRAGRALDLRVDHSASGEAGARAMDPRRIAAVLLDRVRARVPSLVWSFRPPDGRRGDMGPRSPGRPRRRDLPRRDASRAARHGRLIVTTPSASGRDSDLTRVSVVAYGVPQKKPLCSRSRTVLDAKGDDAPPDLGTLLAVTTRLHLRLEY